MILARDAGAFVRLGIPRESGDDPQEVVVLWPWSLYSPRERG